MEEIRKMFIAINNRLEAIEGRLSLIEKRAGILRGPGSEDARIPARAARVVAKQTGYSVDELVGDRRVAPLARARQDAYLRARNMGASYPVIGQYFNRHHTTVIHGCKEATARLAYAGAEQ